jgi:hypothetical protein
MNTPLPPVSSEKPTFRVALMVHLRNQKEDFLNLLRLSIFTITLGACGLASILTPILLSNTWNKALLVAFLGYHIVMLVVDTLRFAQTDEKLGGNLWAPLKMVLTAFLFFPLEGGSIVSKSLVCLLDLGAYFFQ